MGFNNYIANEPELRASNSNMKIKIIIRNRFQYGKICINVIFLKLRRKKKKCEQFTSRI